MPNVPQDVPTSLKNISSAKLSLNIPVNGKLPNSPVGVTLLTLHQLLNEQVSTGFTVPLERIYNGARIVSATQGILRARASVDGTMSNLYLWTTFNSGPQDIIFSLRINNVQQWTGTNRPKIVAGQSSTSKLLLSTPIVLGDLIELDIDQVPSTGITAPITMLITTVAL